MRKRFWIAAAAAAALAGGSVAVAVTTFTNVTSGGFTVSGLACGKTYSVRDVSAGRSVGSITTLACPTPPPPPAPPPPPPPPSTPPPPPPPPASNGATVIQPGASVSAALNAAPTGGVVQLAAGEWPDINLSGINKQVALEWLPGAYGHWLQVSSSSGLSFVNPRLLNGVYGLLMVTGSSHDLQFTGCDFGPHLANLGTWMTSVAPDSSTNWAKPGALGPITFTDCKWHDLTRTAGNHTEGLAIWGAANVHLVRPRFTNIAVYPVSIDRWPNFAGDNCGTQYASTSITIDDGYLQGPDSSIGIYSVNGVQVNHTELASGASVAGQPFGCNIVFNGSFGPGLPGALLGLPGVTWVP